MPKKKTKGTGNYARNTGRPKSAKSSDNSDTDEEENTEVKDECPTDEIDESMDKFNLIMTENEDTTILPKLIKIHDPRRSLRRIQYR